jgi:uncharacterized protein YdaU (DUF1376 family)
MHYYQFNIGDYQSHTAHLSETEDLVYRRLLDWMYLHEKPIPLDLDEVARQIRMRTHSDCIANVLREFFDRMDYGWISERVLKEVEKAGEKSRKASDSAKARWSKIAAANAMRTHSEGNATQDTLPKTQNTVHKEKPQDKPADDLFDMFWTAYPKKMGKDAAKKAFTKRKIGKELLQEILVSLAQQKKTDQWMKDGGQFIPAPATWINQGRWQDEVISVQPNSMIGTFI